MKALRTFAPSLVVACAVAVACHPGHAQTALQPPSHAQPDSRSSSTAPAIRLAQRNPPRAAAAPALNAAAQKHFDAHIAPLLGRHCVECHGPEKRKGGLDLSNRDAAFAGGKNGKTIVPGNANQSRLWEMVESGEMPEDRPPLSAPEKNLLREWIDSGAVWSENPNAPLSHAPARESAGAGLRRLTTTEYIETVRHAVGVDIAQDARRMLPADLRADGFSNTAYNLYVDLSHIEAYARLARIIVGRLDLDAFVGRFVAGRDLSSSSLRKLISTKGRWLLRGPLAENELAAFLTLANEVAMDGGDFRQAASAIIEAMLQSPRFLYRIEGIGVTSRARNSDSYDLASKLSYILWGGPPDEELMRAAEARELSSRARVARQVRRMLQDPRALEQALRFAHEWLDLGRLDYLQPNAKRFPKWDARLAADMREETLAYFKHVAWDQQRPLADLMNAQVTFASPRLADYYGLAAEAAAAGSAEIRPRSGLQSGTHGLVALYAFREGSGDTIRDVSGAGDPLDLRIEDPSAVRWAPGRLTVERPTRIAAPQPPRRLIEAIRKSSSLTIEAWLAPAKADQSGPARIITISSGPNQRNATLGQQGSRFDMRLRTTRADLNGLPSLSTRNDAAAPRLTHVAYTRDTSGRTRLFVNGLDAGSGDVGGDLSNWDAGFGFALANEMTRDRPWLGTFHRVAIYCRALAPEEIQTLSSALSRYDLSAVPARGGLLTHGSLLTIGGDDASMVTRGLFILRDFLWGEVEDPPPCVDTTPVPPKPGMTRRAIAESRLANASCGGCHAKFEPFAFGLERFNGLGAYHEADEHGNRLREDGQILFPDADQPVSYRASAQLMDLLAGNDRLRKGLTRKVAQFALGRPLVAADERVLDKIHAEAWQAGGTYGAVITALVLSDLVR